jgi:SAM-dependent methyltransferase
VPQGQSEELWRRRAASFGSSAADYADHRPDYSADAVAWIVEASDGPARRVLDLGAGTGALTGTLLGRGLDVVAVDPDGGMLAELRRRHPTANATVGSAESIPLAAASVDAVVVGTAFHWFDRDRALPEIARVLRPGGVLGTLYNHTDDSVEWVAELGEVSRTSASSERRADDEDWPPTLGDEFEQWVEGRFAHAHRRTAVSLTATIGTHSHTRVVSDEERVGTLDRIRRFLESRPETSQGEFDVPLTTVANRTRRRPA